jgi:hypothetical protein
LASAEDDDLAVDKGGSVCTTWKGYVTHHLRVGPSHSLCQNMSVNEIVNIALQLHPCRNNRRLSNSLCHHTHQITM